MSHAEMIVRNYQDAFYRGDFRAACAVLADDLDFEGPLEKHSTSRDLLASLERLEPIMKEVRVLKVMSSGDDVCVLYDFITNTDAIGTTRIAEWFHVQDDRIDRIRIYFDPTPYLRLFGSAS